MVILQTRQTEKFCRPNFSYYRSGRHWRWPERDRCAFTERLAYTAGIEMDILFVTDDQIV